MTQWVIHDSEGSNTTPCPLVLPCVGISDGPPSYEGCYSHLHVTDCFRTHVHMYVVSYRLFLLQKHEFSMFIQTEWFFQIALSPTKHNRTSLIKHVHCTLHKNTQFPSRSQALTCSNRVHSGAYILLAVGDSKHDKRTCVTQIQVRNCEVI